MMSEDLWAAALEAARAIFARAEVVRAVKREQRRLTRNAMARLRYRRRKNQAEIQKPEPERDYGPPTECCCLTSRHPPCSYCENGPPYVTCGHCESSGFVNLHQVDEATLFRFEATGDHKVILDWIEAQVEPHDVQICGCCGHSDGWHGTPGEHTRVGDGWDCGGVPECI